MHTIHLSANWTLKAICPTPAKLRKSTNLINGEAEDEDKDKDEDISVEVLDDDKLPTEEELQFEPGDTLGKLLATINQV